MTNQEVINFLDQVREILLDDKSWLESTIQQINEAFDIVISALQAQDVPDINVGDMVSRQKAIDALLKEVRLVDGYYVENDEVIDKDDAIEAIRLLPSVTPKRKTGKWIEEQRSIKVTLYKCSECGRAVIDDTGYDAAKDFPFCHCGADMRSEAEREIE